MQKKKSFVESSWLGWLGWQDEKKKILILVDMMLVRMIDPSKKIIIGIYDVTYVTHDVSYDDRGK